MEYTLFSQEKMILQLHRTCLLFSMEINGALLLTIKVLLSPCKTENKIYKCRKRKKDNGIESSLKLNNFPNLLPKYFYTLQPLSRKVDHFDWGVISILMQRKTSLTWFNRFSFSCVFGHIVVCNEKLDTGVNELRWYPQER